ncbi:unnamed protein product, partial [Rotaria magnacalcarata]
RHAFFDPIGFGILDRADRTKFEREIKNLGKERIESVVDSDLSSRHLQATAKKPLTSNLLNGFLSSVGKRQPQTAKEVTNLSINNELSIYRSLAMQEYTDIIEHSKDHDPFGFWNTHGNKLKFLSLLARKHLVVPCTSVPSESTFSVASYLGRKERSRLTPENLCTLVFLKDKINKSI